VPPNFWTMSDMGKGCRLTVVGWRGSATSSQGRGLDSGESTRVKGRGWVCNGRMRSERRAASRRCVTAVHFVSGILALDCGCSTPFRTLRRRIDVRMHRKTLFLVVTIALIVFGCGRAPEPEFVPLPPQTFDVPAATSQAMQQLDRNGDGKLTKQEFRRSPGLSTSLPTIDQNGDGIVQREEIQSRLQSYVDRKVAVASVAIIVTLDNQPLDDATVELIPEKFMGDASYRAVGTTDRRGIVRPEVSVDRSSPVAQTGFYSGFYKVRVSKRGDNGEELLPPRYNSRTTLGIEVKMGAHVPPIYLRL